MLYLILRDQKLLQILINGWIECGMGFKSKKLEVCVPYHSNFSKSMNLSRVSRAVHIIWTNIFSHFNRRYFLLIYKVKFSKTVTPC
jgi:hypothetical protein